jgi:phosphoribosylanthranilate isomerase
MGKKGANYVLEVRIKICCIQNLAEMELAVGLGAAAVRLVSQMPSGPASMTKFQIRQIAGWVLPGVESVLLTSATKTTATIRQQQYCQTSAIPLVDPLKAALSYTISLKICKQ